MGANVLGLSKCGGYTWRSSNEFAGGGDLEWDAIQKIWLHARRYCKRLFGATPLTNCANWTESMVEWTGHRMCYLYETMKEELDEDQAAEHMI